MPGKKFVCVNLEVWKGLDYVSLLEAEGTVAERERERGGRERDGACVVR